MNSKPSYFFPLLVVLLFFSMYSGQAQYRMVPTEPVQPPPSVLYPEPTYWFLGILGGVDINQHSGDFYTETCERIFTDAEGTGVYLGIQLEHIFAEHLLWGVRIAYNDFSADASYMVKDVSTIVVDDQGNYWTEELDHTYSGDVKLSYVSLNPFVEYNPFGGLYIFAGPSAGLLMTGTYRCLDEVSDEFYFARNDEQSAQEDDYDIPESSSFRLDIRAGLGYNLRLGRSVTFTPEVGYIFGVTKISDDDDWTAHAISAVAILKFDI